MIAAYGIANLLQSIAATRTKTTENLDPGLLLRLFGNRTYLAGLLCQIFGFFFALAARRDLPLFLVQSAVTAGLCVTALLGVLLLKWKLPLAEIALLVLVVMGISALAASAEPSRGSELGAIGIILLIVALAVIAGASVFAGRLKGTLASVVLGSIAGLCFSSAAIAARPLAGAHTIMEFLLNPLLYLVIAHSLTGQLLLGLAMQRGSTNAAVAGMDAAGAVPAAIIGLVLLGDQMRPGREWLAAVGFIVTLGAVIALTRYAEPQHELVAEPAPLPLRYRSASVPGLPEHPARGLVEVPSAADACTTARTHVTIALQRPIRRPLPALNGHAAAGSRALAGSNGHVVVNGHSLPATVNGSFTTLNGHAPAVAPITLSGLADPGGLNGLADSADANGHAGGNGHALTNGEGGLPVQPAGTNGHNGHTGHKIALPAPVSE
jgi:drug/metabolite transporter (DMT)-like permease